MEDLKEYIKNKIKIYYFEKNQYTKEELKLATINEELYELKGISYDKLPNQKNTTNIHAREMKLAVLLDKKAEVERHVEAKKFAMLRTENELKLSMLTLEDMKLLDAVNTTKNYVEAGKMIGYTKKYVWKMYDQLIKKICEFAKK